MAEIVIESMVATFTQLLYVQAWEAVTNYMELLAAASWAAPAHPTPARLCRPRRVPSLGAVWKGGRGTKGPPCLKASSTSRPRHGNTS